MALDLVQEALEEAARRRGAVEHPMEREPQQELVEVALHVRALDVAGQPLDERVPARGGRTEDPLGPQGLRAVDRARDEPRLLEPPERRVDGAWAAAVAPDGHGLEGLPQVVSGLGRLREQAEQRVVERSDTYCHST
jgi:hypothetical protein